MHIDHNAKWGLVPRKIYFISLVLREKKIVLDLRFVSENYLTIELAQEDLAHYNYLKTFPESTGEVQKRPMVIIIPKQNIIPALTWFETNYTI